MIPEVYARSENFEPNRAHRQLWCPSGAAWLFNSAQHWCHRARACPCTFPPHSFFSFHFLPLELQLTGKTTQLLTLSPKGLQTRRFPSFAAIPAFPEALPKSHHDFPQLWNVRTELSASLPSSLRVQKCALSRGGWGNSWIVWLWELICPTGCWL